VADTSFFESESDIDYTPLVLVVADDEEMRDGIEQLLSSDGYHIEAARHEADAIERASRCCPDLILVSLNGTPAEVVAAAVRIRRGAEIDVSVPVVVFCVPTIDEGAEVPLGRNVYATRPDNFNQLRAFLERLIVQSIQSA